MAERAMQEATFLILTALATGSQHGYGIITEVSQISGGRVRLRAGTLYTALDRLRIDEMIAVDREEIVDNRLRRYYRLTPGLAEAGRRGRAAAGERRRGPVPAGPGGGHRVTGSAGLEQGYRRLLGWYPRAFRRDHADGYSAC